jgi:hypothetical protein
MIRVKYYLLFCSKYFTRIAGSSRNYLSTKLRLRRDFRALHRWGFQQTRIDGVASFGCSSDKD